jgi:hypothetical protein
MATQRKQYSAELKAHVVLEALSRPNTVNEPAIDSQKKIREPEGGR